MAVLVGAVVLAGLTPTGSASAAVDRPALPGQPVTTALVPGDTYTFSLQSGGMRRSYLLHLPPAAASGKHLPLVLNLHGSTQNGQLQELQSGMDSSADRNGFLVAYPNGTRVSKVLTPDPVAKDAQYSWNAGACCGLPVTRDVDDVAFLKQVIANIGTKTPLDRRRIYVTGMSSGGMMAYRMAAQDSGQIAAIASVAGQVELRTIDPTRPVPTMEFHSVDDPVATWAGTAHVKPKDRNSVMQGVQKWAAADRCRTHPHVARTIVGGAGTESAGESATLVTYTGCSSGTEVALWRLTGSGHVWPGAPFNLGPSSSWILQGVGRGTVLVDANQAMWEFFKQYSLRSG
jgi:polyhydroxybutyrate depolymerase